MKARVLVCLGFLIAVGLVSCGKKVEQGPALWHLSDADSDIYLFGTFHLLPEGLDWQRPAMIKAFDQSSILIMEADVAGAAPGDVVALIRDYGIAPPDRPLRSRLSASDVARYENVAAGLGLEPAMLDPYEPWYAATILTIKYAEKHGFEPSQGAEEKLLRAAETENKPTAYLETIEEQIRFLAGLPDQTQSEMFAATLDEIETSDAMLNDMQEAWVKGDTTAMAALFDKSLRDIPDLYRVLVIDRNRRWADEIEKLMAGSGKAFIAVGAGHLIGDDSVVALLRERGFDVAGP
jgi:hypothetical protein